MTITLPTACARSVTDRVPANLLFGIFWKEIGPACAPGNLTTLSCNRRLFLLVSVQSGISRQNE